MEFLAYHGCLPEERRNGNSFIVDFFCEYDISRAVQTDDIADTLDYSSIYNIIAEEMKVPSNLLENVAARIADSISAAYPELEHFTVKVAKRNPPVAGTARSAGVTIER